MCTYCQICDSKKISLVLRFALDIGDRLLTLWQKQKKYGVKLIMSLVDYYNDYGGKPQFVKWDRKSGPSFNNDDDFYTDPVTKNNYKYHLKVCYVPWILIMRKKKFLNSCSL